MLTGSVHQCLHIDSSTESLEGTEAASEPLVRVPADETFGLIHALGLSHLHLLTECQRRLLLGYTQI